MFPEDINEKLQLLDSDNVIPVPMGDELTITEDCKTGEAFLTCKMKSDTVVFLSPENHVFPYLSQTAPRARVCPDVFIFAYNTATDCWDLHIIEFKKTVTLSAHQKAIRQFEKGIYNARSIAGFLNRKIDTITVYIAYRAERLTESDCDISFRTGNSMLEAVEWGKNICTLEIDAKECEFPHLKIKLDNNGNGSCEI